MGHDKCLNFTILTKAVSFLSMSDINAYPYVIEPMNPLGGKHQSKFWDAYTEPVQILVSFVFGLAFSPFSLGLFYLFAYIIINELVVVTYMINTKQRYHIGWRAAIIFAGIIGFVVGRASINDDEMLRSSYTRVYEKDRTKVRLRRHSRLRKV